MNQEGRKTKTVLDESIYLIHPHMQEKGAGLRGGEGGNENGRERHRHTERQRVK